jgi:single-strand DNA-binding protein
MKSMNTVQLIGWLGKDPEIRTTKNGKLLAKLRIATDLFIRQKDGPPKNITTWHDVTLWRQNQIEFFLNSLTKGSHILVDGRIEYRQYLTKKGELRKGTEIIANYIIDLDR